jgi:N-acetylneuraminic acid mutarotase
MVTVSWRTFITLLCVPACSFACAKLLAFVNPKTPTKVPHRALTFEERVSYQRAIEQVYYRHRIWPKESSNPKPSLDAVMPRAQLEKGVENYLRNSQVLDQYWQTPVTAEQLQAEMDRMAKQTKQADVLRELFEALGNDPFVIAECLARPVLIERTLSNKYAYDQRIHGQLKGRAESDLLAHPGVKQMQQTSGTYTETDLVKTIHGADKHLPGTVRSSELDDREWDETVGNLAATFNRPKNTSTEAYESIPVGQLGPLQENEVSFYVTAVTEKTQGHLKLAMVTWSKKPVEVWRAGVEEQLPASIVAPNAGYTLPAVSGATGGCSNDSWAVTSLNIPTPRDVHTAIWTGSEMIIWGGGFGDPLTPTNTGSRHNPSTDAWTTMSTVNAPSPRGGHNAVWTGSEMIVWGGGWLNTGGRYNPVTDSWTPISTTNAPSARSGHSGVWTGSEMIVWDGFDGVEEFNSGGLYNPVTNSWRATSTINAPSPRLWHSTVWTGSEMIVWGGYVYNDINQTLNTGGKYNPSTDSWTAVSTTNAPSPRQNHTAVWTGNQMVVWGGLNLPDPANSHLNTGARYDPATSWTGKEMIVWGGEVDDDTLLNTGGRYDPSVDAWTRTSVTTAPSIRGDPAAVWTGKEMIVWGGFDNTVGWLNTGGKYDPKMG